MASLQFHDADWHGDLRTPVVDGKYIDPKTGELHTVKDYAEEHGEPGYYRGPPSVDIIIQSIHADTTGCVYRAARPFPMEALLAMIMKMAKERKLSIDSVVATTYTIRVILCHKLTKDEFNQIAGRMVNGIWDEKE